MQDLAKGKIIIKSPAKINLHLEVIGKREDGFHELARLCKILIFLIFWNWKLIMKV